MKWMCQMYRKQLFECSVNWWKWCSPACMQQKW